MKKRENIYFLILIGIIVVSALGIFSIVLALNMKKHETKNPDGSILIRRSVTQGDEQYDTRRPEDVCAGLLADVQKEHPGKSCRLIQSKRLDSDRDGSIEEECVNGASVGGCFACRFECK